MGFTAWIFKRLVCSQKNNLKSPVPNLQYRISKAESTVPNLQCRIVSTESPVPNLQGRISST